MALSTDEYAVMTTTGKLRPARADLGEDLEPGAVREHQVEEQEVDGLAREPLETLGRGPGLDRAEAGLSEDRSEHVPDDGLVVEDEDRHDVRSRAAGGP